MWAGCVGGDPAVDVVAALNVSLTAKTQRRGVDVGTKPFALDSSCGPSAQWWALGTT